MFSSVSKSLSDLISMCLIFFISFISLTFLSLPVGVITFKDGNPSLTIDSNPVRGSARSLLGLDAPLISL